MQISKNHPGSLRTKGSKALIVYAGIGLCFLAFFIVLPTQQYSGDGLRWYGTIAGLRAFELSGTNHLLYAPLLRLYFHAARLAGAQPSFALAQSMNALFGAGTIACFAFIVRTWTQNWLLTLGSCAILAFSRAFSMHATDMTEPMPGVFFSMLAMAFVSSHVQNGHDRWWKLVVAGLSIGIATSIYQSNMFTIIGAAAMILLCSSTRGKKQRFVEAVVTAAIAGVTALCLYIAAFMLSGNASNLGEAIRLSMTTENDSTQGIYSEFGLRRFGVLIFGLGEALFGLRGANAQMVNDAGQGLSNEIILAGVITLWSATCLVIITLSYLFEQRRITSDNKKNIRMLLLALIIWLIPNIGLLVFFGARYTKLWIIPTAIITLMMACMIQWLSSAYRDKRMPRPAQLAQYIFWLGLCIPVTVVGLGVNLIPDHFSPNPGLIDAQAIRQITTERDLVISDWGGIPYDPAPSVRTFSIVASMFKTKLHAEETIKQIEEEIKRTDEMGGHTYFYGMLDDSAAEWSPFMERRLRMPYRFVEMYRGRSLPARQLAQTTPLGNTSHLWRLVEE